MFQPVSACFIPQNTVEILNRIAGGGLTISYRFTRSPHLYSPAMTTVELLFSNVGSADITEIKLEQKQLPAGMLLHEFAPISQLSPNSTLIGTLGIDFADSTQPVSFDVIANGRANTITLRPPVGELIRAVTMPEHMFISEQSKYFLTYILM